MVLELIIFWLLNLYIVFVNKLQDIDRLTLNGISFDVGMDKRLLAIVGPVGAGKVCTY